MLILLLVCIVWADTWLESNRPVWAYFSGLLPCLLMWAGAMYGYSRCVPLPSSAMLNCEWIGIGMLFATSAAGGFGLAYTLLFVALYVRHRRKNSWA